METDTTVRLDVYADGDELAAEVLGRQLRAALMEDDLEALPVRDPDAPVGARAGGAELPSAVLLKFGPQLVGRAARAIMGWFHRSRLLEVELTIAGNSIRLSHATPQQQERLIELLEAQIAEGG